MLIEDYGGCPLSQRYYGGRAGRKVGVLIDGEPWILKFPRPGRDLVGKHVPSYTSSPVSEWISSHIYESLGIPAHVTRLGYRDGHVVCACKDFTWPDKRLVEFGMLKTTMSDEQEGFGGSPSDGAALYLADVLATIDQVPLLRDTPGVLDRFWDMFVVDALIKNPDRNNGNWGLLAAPDGSFGIAPVYDCGSSLFSKRTDSLATTRLGSQTAVDEDAFTNNRSCYLIVGEDGKAHHVKPFDYMAQSSDPLLMGAMRRVAERFDAEAIDAVIDEVPREFRGRLLLGDGMRESHKRLIRERFERGVLPLAGDGRNTAVQRQDDVLSAAGAHVRVAGGEAHPSGRSCVH